MMKSKIVLMIVMMLILSSSVSAIGKVFVIDFNYDEGLFSLNDKAVKFGHYPDRKIQPDDGYICEIISYEDEVLYSFMFDVPLKIYTDSSSELDNSLSGGYIVLDNVDFALVIPYFDNAKAIRIYKPGRSSAEGGFLVNVEDVQLSSESGFFISGIAFGVLLLLILLLLLLRKRRRDR